MREAEQAEQAWQRLGRVFVCSLVGEVDVSVPEASRVAFGKNACPSRAGWHLTRPSLVC